MPNNNAKGERCANSAYAPTDCSVCGKPHRLSELDAGTDREIERMCESCFKQNMGIMARKLKVYGCGHPWNHNIAHFRANGSGQVRTVIATTSWNKFSDALNKVGCNANVNFLRKYGCETGNEKEIEICLANPNQLFYTPEHTTIGFVKEYFPWGFEPTKGEMKVLAEKTDIKRIAAIMKKAKKILKTN